MTSNTEYFDSTLIIEKLTAPLFLSQIDVHLPELIVFLETNFVHKDFLPVIKTLLKDVLRVHSIDLVQTLYLQDVLEVTRKIFCDCLENALLTVESSKNGTVQDGQISLQQLLSVALDILEGYSILLNELLTQPMSLEAGKLQSVPRNIVLVVHNAFNHCKDSEFTYGNSFTSSADILSTLFKKSFDIQTNVMRLLDEKLIFNCNLEDDLSLLLEVLERVSGVGEIVVGMDLKAAVDQWKVFAKLACKHAEQLKARLDLVVPLCALSKTLQHVIQTVTSDQNGLEKAAQLRYLKLGNFILKVIIKLCDLYSGYLGDCHKHLLELLIILNKNDQQLDESNDLFSEFKSYLSIGTAPLLSHLLSDRQFISEFKQLSCDLSPLTCDAKLGVFTLTCNIMRKLVKSTPDVQRLWWKNDLLQSVLNVVRDCSKDIDRVIKFDEKEGYSCLVATVSILMASLLVGAEFHNSERIMFSTLCTGEFFSSVFVQDLFCLLARLTKEGIVVKWLEWLKKAIPFSEGPVRVHFMLLEKRLMNFLSPKTLAVFRDSNSTKMDFSSSSISSQIKNFNDIIQRLSAITDEGDVSKTCEWVCEIWQAAERCRPKIEFQETAVRGLHWWTLLINRLASATKKLFSNFTNQQLKTCLDVTKSVVDGSDSYSRGSCTQILCGSSQRISMDSSLCSSFVQLASVLCTDSDPVISQLALEALCPSLQTGELYSAMVTSQPHLENILAPYLAKRIHSINESNTFDILDSLSNDEYCHKCLTRSNEEFQLKSTSTEATKNVSPPAKKAKVSHEFDSLVLQGTQLCEKIDKYLTSNTLNNSERSLLESFLKDSNSLNKYL